MEKPMVKKNIYFPPPLWERLLALSELEGIAIADVLRRLLSSAVGLDDAIMARVELDEDAGDPVPQLKRALVHQRLEHAKVANALARLTLDVDDLVAADTARQAAWEGLQSAFEQLSADMQRHVDRSEVLFRQVAENQAGLYAGLRELRSDITALHNAVKEIGLINLDTLRRLTALESGLVDEQTAEARARGDQWVARVESELLIASSDAAERGEHE